MFKKLIIAVIGSTIVLAAYGVSLSSLDANLENFPLNQNLNFERYIFVPDEGGHWHSTRSTISIHDDVFNYVRLGIADTKFRSYAAGRVSIDQNSGFIGIYIESSNSASAANIPVLEPFDFGLAPSAISVQPLMLRGRHGCVFLRPVKSIVCFVSDYAFKLHKES